jgi:hypothetical protein
MKANHPKSRFSDYPFGRSLRISLMFAFSINWPFRKERFRFLDFFVKM